MQSAVTWETTASPRSWQSIPYNFYALLTIFFVFFMLITNKNDYGPMRAAKEEAKSSEGATAEGGKLLEKLSTMGLSDQAEADPDDAYEPGIGRHRAG